MTGSRPPDRCYLRMRPKPIPGWIGDHRDDWSLEFIPVHRRWLDMKASTKTILFTRVTVDKQVHLWPTAVFANDKEAKAYATLLKMAHDTNNGDLATQLDPETRKGEDGTLVKGVKFSIRIAPYAPTPGDSGADPFAD